MPIGKIISLPNGNLQLVTSEHGKLTLTRWKIIPLKLTDLKNYKENGEVCIVFSDVTVLEDPKITEIAASFKIPDKLGSYCLVAGGWLPPVFGMINGTVFADRNFISKLASNFFDDKAKSADLAEWFSDIKNLNFRIDIIPYAMEGNKKYFQSRDDIASQIEEARNKLRVAVPGVPIVEYAKPLQDYAWHILTHLKPFIQKRMDFLTQVAPLVKPSTKKEIILQRWQSIADVAKCHGLNTDIILFLALISVSSSQKDSPGLGILKINHPYPTELAYNACFDICLMELFMNMQNMDSSGKYTIVTSDLALTRLGGLLNDLNHKKSDGAISTFSSRIPQELIGNDPALHKEFQRITSGAALGDSSE